MKFCLTILVMVVFCVQISAQKFYTRDGMVSFSSEAPMEKIEADNHKVSSVLNSETGEIEFAVLVKSFHFDKALMEEHFNENYMESNKFPKATFKGKISNLEDIQLTTDGSYRASVEGSLTVHGVTRQIQTEGVLSVKDDLIHATANFEIAVADYEIEIPKVVRENVAKLVQIKVDLNYKPMAQ